MKIHLESSYRAGPDNEYGPITNTGLFIGPFWPNNEYGGLFIGSFWPDNVIGPMLRPDNETPSDYRCQGFDFRLPSTFNYFFFCFRSI